MFTDISESGIYYNVENIIHKILKAGNTVGRPGNEKVNSLYILSKMSEENFEFLEAFTRCRVLKNPSIKDLFEESVDALINIVDLMRVIISPNELNEFTSELCNRVCNYLTCRLSSGIPVLEVFIRVNDTKLINEFTKTSSELIPLCLSANGLSYKKYDPYDFVDKLARLFEIICFINIDVISEESPETYDLYDQMISKIFDSKFAKWSEKSKEIFK